MIFSRCFMSHNTKQAVTNLRVMIREWSKQYLLWDRVKCISLPWRSLRGGLLQTCSSGAQWMARYSNHSFQEGKFWLEKRKNSAQRVFNHCRIIVEKHPQFITGLNKTQGNLFFSKPGLTWKPALFWTASCLEWHTRFHSKRPFLLWCFAAFYP